MVLERAEIPVKPGQSTAFVTMMQDEGLNLLAGADGCTAVRLGRGVENPDLHILLLEWESVAHHLDFTKTEAFDEFKALAGPYFAGPPRMEHFEVL